MLLPGERAIASEPVQAVLGANLQSGHLYLTNVRLVYEGFFHEPSVGWVPRTLLDLHLGHVTNVVAIPGKRNRSTLRIEAGRGYVYTFLTPSATNWVSSIVQARQGAPQMPLPASAMGAHAPVVVNVHPAPAQPSVYLHCKHCGALATAGSVHCTSCGATL